MELFHWVFPHLEAETPYEHLCGLVLSPSHCLDTFHPSLLGQVAPIDLGLHFLDLHIGLSLLPSLPSPKAAMFTNPVTHHSILLLAVDVSVPSSGPFQLPDFCRLFPPCLHRVSHTAGPPYKLAELHQTISLSGKSFQFPMASMEVLPGMGGSDGFLISFYQLKGILNSPRTCSG